MITEDDFVTVSLNSGFIKHFFEIIGTGELALIVSFDAGNGAVENVLIHSARGHTPGSFFALDDWPVLGPLRIVGDHLRIRVVLIELDQPESEQARNLIKFLSQTAGTVAPGLAGLFSVTQPIVDQLIGLSTNDVVLDYRFSLRRTRPGMPVTESPLLYGKYVLVLQQDRLGSGGDRSLASLAVTPIVINEMRFDRFADRVQKVYNYEEQLAEDAGEGPIGISDLVVGVSELGPERCCGNIGPR